MQIPGFVSLDSIEIPEGWQEDAETSTAIMLMKQFHPPEHPDVEIAFFKRRKPLPPDAMACLFRTLEQPPHLVEQGGAEIISLNDALGNVGNNQWSNRQSGLDAAGFRMLHAQSSDLNGKNVLIVSGAFIEPDTKKPVNEYCGLFVPVTVPQPFIEEIYLQVPSKYGYLYFEKYLKVFRQTINTIVWLTSFAP
ncbi:MAG: hypothetical protein P4L53_00640 [Candidatus Obscuribacterales bacterium]|nr:hypothetical protein [Candidatus Obscuribacterales bacterium]